MEKVSISCHPQYDKMFPIWEQLYITAELGEKGVKEKGEAYLSPTEGQREDWKDKGGKERYEAYKQRATYYNFCQETIKKAMGLVHSKDATFVASDKLKKWAEIMTVDKANIQSLARDITSAQLLLGRLGLLLDYPADGGTVPYVSQYSADAMLAWEEYIDKDELKISWVLLDETGLEFNNDSKTYERKEKYRLLALDTKGEYYQVPLTQSDWLGWDIKNPDTKHEGFIYPLMPTKRLRYIPFVPVNIKKTTMSVDRPLLIELSNLALSAYRSDADYRQGLYNQAFALLYMLGFNEAKVKKQGVRADGFAVSDNANAKVGYASADGDGLAEMRASLTDLKKESEGTGIVISDKEGVESGKALKTRISLQTSDLKEINLTAGEAITKILKMAQECLGDKEEFTYEPNLDFDQEKATTRELLDFWNVCVSGGTNLKNIYNWSKKNDLAFELTYEDWLANVQESMSLLGYTAQTADSNVAFGNESEEPEGEEGESEENNE